MKKFNKILLVYPEVPNNTFWSFKYALKFLKKKSAMPPLGIITVAALFPEEYDLKLIDMNVELLNDKDIIWADAVFISAMIVQKNSMERVIAACNRLGTKVVLGGPHPTASYKEIHGVDHFVLGEVEDMFREFLDDLENGVAKKLYPLPERPDMFSRAIIPRFDLLNLKAYSSMSVQFCRGCPFKCEFCDIWKVYGNKPRLKNPEYFLYELDNLYDSGWRGPVFIVDDNFIGNKGKIKKWLLPALKKWQEDHNFVYRFFTEASINLAEDEELLAGMRDAGFNEVFIGIETPSTQCLKETGKTQNLKTDMQGAVRKIQQYGLEVMAGFILGFDSDTDDIFERQISFIQETGIPKAMVGLLTALPGTNLYSRLLKEGRIIGKSSGNNTDSISLNFKTIMARMKLIKGYKNVLSNIYDSNLKNYFIRCNKLIDNLGDTVYFKRKFRIHDLMILFRSVFYQPFTPYGYQYIKFVIRNFIKHRKIFSETIRFSIIGHHFHTITQERRKIEKIISYMDEKNRYLSEQISRYSEIVIDGSRELPGNIADLWNQKKKILDKTRNKINKIHVDFRDETIAQYNDAATRMQALFCSFEKDLIKYGITV